VFFTTRAALVNVTGCGTIERAVDMDNPDKKACAFLTDKDAFLRTN